MSGLTIIGPSDQLAELLANLAAELRHGIIAEVTIPHNGPGADLTLTLETDESDVEAGVGVVAEWTEWTP